MSSELVRRLTMGRVAVLELNRPHRRNAIDVEMASRLITAIDDVDADADIGALVIRGAGGTFCSGGDRDELDAACEAPLDDHNLDRISMLYESFLRLGRCAVPTLAAIRGAAVGAGVNLALAADVRIMATDARLVPGFHAIGLHPGGGHMHLLARAAGAQTAAAMGMLGAPVRGQRAAELGIAWEAVPDESVETRALELAEATAINPALARLTKRSFVDETTPGVTWSTSLSVERVAQLWSFARAGERKARD